MKNPNGQKEEPKDTALTLLPAVGDSFTYIGSSREREMNIKKQDSQNLMDTVAIDTTYSVFKINI